MRSPTLLFLAASMLIGGVSLGRAQTADSPAPTPTPRPPPPAPPFVKSTADFSAWTITRYTIQGIRGQSVDAVAGSTVKNIKPESVTTVTKTGSIRHQLRKLNNGDQEDIWYERGSRITMESMWKHPVFQGDTSGPKSPVGPDFPEFGWVTAGNFVGTHEEAGGTFLVFETQVSEGSAVAAKEYGYKQTTSFNRAYINAETRLPSFLQTGDVVQRYAFQSAPTTPLEVPPEYQMMFDNYDKRRAEMARKPIAP